MATIYLRDLVVSGRHGVHPHEKETAQPFNISIELEFDTTAAQVSDQLADTIDYAAVRATIIAVVEQNSFNLLERLAQAIADRLFEDKRLSELTVLIEKLQAFETGIPAVKLTFRQQS